MDSNKSPNSKPSRYPDFGKLTVALIEHAVEPILGKDFIIELKTPYSNRQLFNELRDALLRAEKVFIQQNLNLKISKELVQLSLKKTNSLQRAFWNFVKNPASSEFPLALYRQLCSDYPNTSDSERQLAVDNYLQILKTEIVNINDETRQKVSAAVLLSVQEQVENIGKHTESIDSKMDKIVDLLSKLSTPFAASNVGDAPVREGLAREIHLGMSTKMPPQHIALSINESLGNLASADIENLREIIENWIPPLIEQYISLDDYDRPYGKICESVIETQLSLVQTRIETSLLFSVYTFGSDASRKIDKEYERFGIINRIFKSQLRKSLPNHEFRNCIYLKSLSGLFPQSATIKEPYGFYLIDLLAPQMERPLRDFLLKELRKKYKLGMGLNDSERLQLIYISDNKLDGRNNLSIIDDKKESANWKDNLNLVTKTIVGKKPKHYFYIVIFDEKYVQFIPLDLDNIGNRTSYKLEISLQEFAHFITGFTEDFLSLASKTILTERQARDGNQILANQLKKNQ